MSYLGDFTYGTTVFHKFTTVNSSAGVPTALSSAGITVYRDGSTVQDATGVSLTADFDTVTGLNHLAVSMATAGFYSSAGEYQAVISSGGIGSDNVAGYVIAEWSLERRPSVDAKLWGGTAVGGMPSTLSSTEVGAGVWNSTRSNYTASGSFGELVSTSTAAPLLPISTAAVITLAAQNSTIQSSDVDGVLEWPGAGTPSTAPTRGIGLAYMYHALRNRITVSSSAKVFHDPADVTIWGKVLSQDSTGSTGVYQEAEASTST